MSDITAAQIRPTDESGFLAAEYNLVAKVAELVAINLIKVKSSFAPGVNIDEKAKLSFGRKVLSCGFDSDQSAAHAVFQYFVKGTKSGKTVFSISADYAVIYLVEGDVAPNAAKAFVHNVGVFAAYAYFRAVAAHLAWSANLELPPLPMIATQAYKPKD
jgi:hypothetical protein